MDLFDGDHARDQAEQLVEQLMQPGRRHDGGRVDAGRDEWRGERPGEGQRDTAAGAVAMADVEGDVAQFRGQLDLLETFDLDFPAHTVRHTGDWLEPEEAIPMSLRMVNPDGPYDFEDVRYSGLPGEFIHRRLQRDFEVARQEIDGFVTVPRRTAIDSFRTRLTSFLATRIAAGNGGDGPAGWPGAHLLRLPWRRGGAPATVPGCTFVVTTNSPGLRVFWSGAYFVTGNYFAHPTSPASSTLQAGTYVFGVDGGPYTKIAWDTAAVVTLPGSPSLHLNY